ncbi:unnamed protein product [Penicillium bialowiezense]
MSTEAVEAAIQALPQQRKLIFLQLENIYFDYINRRDRDEISKDIVRLSQALEQLPNCPEEKAKGQPGFPKACGDLASFLRECVGLMKEFLQGTLVEFMKGDGQADATEPLAWRFRTSIADRRLSELSLGGGKSV